MNRGSTVSRQSDLQYARIGTLKKITYPTGGSAEYDYSLHDYYDPGYVETFFYEARADDNDPVDIVHFTVNEQAYATMETNVAIPGPGNLTEFRKKDASDNYVIYVPAQSVPGNRVVLPAGDYRLLVSTTGGDKFINVEFEQTVEKKFAVAGGLRVAKTTLNDGAQTIVKHFDYRSGDESDDAQLPLTEPPYTLKRSSGVLFTPPLLGGHISTHYEELPVPGGCQVLSVTNYINLNAYTQLPLAVYHGSHIGYSEVHVYDLKQQGRI